MQESGALPPPDLVVGTSAGSAVGAQLLSGTPLADLYARQVDDEHGEIAPALDLDALIAFYTSVGDLSAGASPEVLRQVGAFAKATTTVPLAARREVIAWRLPSHDWPSTPLIITTVDADTGERVVLDRDSDVALVDAVMASCAVPGVWPTVPLLGRTLMDGGVMSPVHLDLAEDCDEVLVLVPLAGPGLGGLQREIDALGARTRLVTVDEDAVAAIGPDVLDPAKRRVAAEHGLRQGRALAQTGTSTGAG